MPQNHVQPHAQKHEWVWSPKNKVKFFFSWGITLDLERGGFPSPSNPLAMLDAMYKGGYHPPYEPPPPHMWLIVEIIEHIPNILPLVVFFPRGAIGELSH